MTFVSNERDESWIWNLKCASHVDISLSFGHKTKVINFSFHLVLSWLSLATHFKEQRGRETINCYKIRLKITLSDENFFDHSSECAFSSIWFGYYCDFEDDLTQNPIKLDQQARINIWFGFRSNDFFMWPFRFFQSTQKEKHKKRRNE